jgi:uncharacterized protein YkwD
MRNPFPDRTDEAFLQEMLTSINADRAKHGGPPVVFDSTLTAYAKSRAALTSTEPGLSRGHKDLDPKYGENLFWGASSGQTASSATAAADSWYSEIKNYNFANPAASGPGTIGHFTQLVWKASTKIGAGRVFGQDGEWWETYIAVTFEPPGNMAGAYEANVAPPS